MTEFQELDHAWRFFCEQNSFKSTPNHPTAGAWVEAAARLLECGGGTELERLNLLIEMHSQLGRVELLPLVQIAIVQLEEAGLDGTEASKCSSVLEQVVMSLLPFDVQEKARAVVSGVAAKMLTRFGDALTLEEIRSVADALHESGFDQAAAGDAACAALTGYIGELSSTLSDLSSMRQLDEYEEELQAAMNAYGLIDQRAARRIESRREELADNEERGRGSYSGWSGRSPSDISDNEIRSMFGELRSR
jgi:hypothetical protein